MVCKVRFLKPMIVAVPMAFLLGCGDSDPVAENPPTPAPAVAPSAAGVSEARAREVALARVGGGEVTQVSSHDEQDQPRWQVEVTKGGREYDVEINRTSGAVVSVDESGDPPGNENEPDENEPDEN